MALGPAGPVYRSRLSKDHQQTSSTTKVWTSAHKQAHPHTHTQFKDFIFGFYCLLDTIK